MAIAYVTSQNWRHPKRWRLSFGIDHALAATDKDGITVADALDEIGYRGTSSAVANQSNLANRMCHFVKMLYSMQLS